MFGFAHATIAKLIQDMPGAEKCEKYIRQQFVPATAKLKLADTLSLKKKGQKGGKRLKKQSSSDEEDSDDDIMDDDDEGPPETIRVTLSIGPRRPPMESPTNGGMIMTTKIIEPSRFGDESPKEKKPVQLPSFPPLVSSPILVQANPKMPSLSPIQPPVRSPLSQQLPPPSPLIPSHPMQAVPSLRTLPMVRSPHPAHLHVRPPSEQHEEEEEEIVEESGGHQFGALHNPHNPHNPLHTTRM
jgi:hypothetical protein